MSDKLNRNYNVGTEIINEANRTFKNIAVQEAKKVILANAIGGGSLLNPLGIPTIVNSAEAVIEGLAGVGSSIFGLPVWDTLRLYYVDPVNIPDIFSFKFPIVLMTVTNQKNIVVTPITGMDGTIKEYISNSDVKISLKCAIVGNGVDYYPGKKIKELSAILDVKDTIKVYSTILNDYMGIHNVVVTGYNFTQQEEGMRNVQYVEIDLISDNPEQYDVFMLT